MDIKGENIGDGQDKPTIGAFPNSQTINSSLQARTFDNQEDACTQTERKKKPKLIEEVCYPQFPDFLLPEDEQEFRTVGYLESPPSRKKTSQHHKNKTPNTVKLLMEKHRENERLRHHSLNEHLRLICKKVPGSREDGKETKVVMMQRMISYIAYLENTLRNMSSEVETDVDPSLLLLTSNYEEIEQSGPWKGKDVFTYSSEDSKDSTNLSLSRRLKLSSPTVDSTTDSMTSTSDVVATDSFEIGLHEDSQDSAIPSSNYSVEIHNGMDDVYQDFLQPAEEVIISETGSFDLGDSQYDSAIFDLPSSNFEVLGSTEEVKWLGSPDLNISQAKQDVGIKCDRAQQRDHPGELIHAVIVSPDQILPQPTVKLEQVVPDRQALHGTPEFNMSQKQCHVQSASRCKKRKQMSPRRVPLFNVTNLTDIMDDGSGGGSVIPDLIVCDDHNESGTPYIIGNFEEVLSSGSHSINNSHPTANVDLAQSSSTAVLKTSLPHSSRLDLRKSSWMNGFMMYSRIHRKQFIRANPGVHTAVISKMMGQSWRSMSSADQEPYKEQARVFSQQLQSVLEEHKQVYCEV